MNIVRTYTCLVHETKIYICWQCYSTLSVQKVFAHFQFDKISIELDDFAIDHVVTYEITYRAQHCKIYFY